MSLGRTPGSPGAVAATNSFLASTRASITGSPAGSTTRPAIRSVRVGPSCASRSLSLLSRMTSRRVTCTT
jgi:hypothetical protein